MNRVAMILLAGAAVLFATGPSSHAASPTLGGNATNEAGNPGKDRIGLTATQRQMIAWSIAAFAEMQPAPSRFQAAPGTKAPESLSLSQVPAIVQGVAPPAANYDYAMLDNKDLVLVSPADGTIADIIHLNRRL